MKIAIIEDSSVVANFFKKFLTDVDYDLSIYHSNLEDIDRLCHSGADLVICPGFPTHQDGPLIVSRLHSDPKFQKTSFIISTSLESTELQSEWDFDTIDGILLKPFTKNELLAVVENVRTKQQYLARNTPLAVVVDDSSTVRAVLEQEMKSLGFDVLTAVNGREGVDLVFEFMPNIVLTDIEMPIKTGLELCQELYSDPRTSQIPIIVISSLVNDAQVRNGFSYGASHFLKKPVDSATLSAAVASVMGKNNTLREGSALVVEPQLTTASIIMRELEKIGVRSNHCRSIAELDAFLAVSRPDLVTLDLALPDGDGASVCRRLRRREDLSAMTLIVISDEKDRAAIVKCLNGGANDFLTKPFTTEEFEARVQSHLRTMSLHKELARRNRMLETLAYQDSLTGLLNRRYLDEALDRELDRAETKAGSLGFMMIDLDKFKKVNDTYGHNVGDEILKVVASEIQSSVGNHGIACRYGGEEMCVFLPDVSLTKCRELAERIRRSCESQKYTAHGITQTLSIGVTIYPEYSYRTTLVEDADQALYQAKNEGRNRVKVWGGRQR